MASGNDKQKLDEICAKTYKEQAIWFLNAFWDDLQGEAEKLWAYVEKANKIDLEKHEDGSGLDELNAHRLLEIFDETLTVREMRTQLRKVGAIEEKERPKLVPLAHLLLARYKSDWHHFVNAPQGNQEELDKAQAQLDATKAAFQKSEAALQAATEAEASAKQREQEARAAEASAKQREASAHASAEAAAKREAESKAAAEELAAKEAELKAAQDEVAAALAEVQAQEDAYNAKTESLKQKSETGGVVSRNRAKNELAQHLGEDPLPLRRAKITLEAANRRADKATKAAAAAREVADKAADEASKAKQAADADAQAATQARQAAEQAAQAATAAREDAEQKRAASEEALEAAQAALAEAEAFLEEVKKHAGGGKGALWWIERELHEQKKYLPTSRGGIARK